MADLFSTIFTTSIISMLISTLVSLVLLKTLCIANQDFLGFLYISSGKSTTNARLLGGLALSVSLITSLSFIIFFYPQNISPVEKSILVHALVSICIVTLYGYIDDKHEVRVRFKLSLQLTAILSFAQFNASIVSAEHSILAFVFLSVLGLALVNGTNLLDGLDSLSVKLGISSSLAFLYLGIIAQNPTTIYLSLILISSLTVFYFFNREPAKIYMGEIGGSIIGLIYFVQSTICFSVLKSKMTSIDAISLVLIAALFPIYELGISFLRRILSKKTPFRGDKLHLHYVLKNKYKLSASVTSTRMGLASFCILVLGFSMAKTFGPLIAVTAVSVITLQGYLWICLDEWRTSIASDSLENMFKIFEGKKVNIIDSTKFSTIDISIKDDEKSTKDSAIKKKSA